MKKINIHKIVISEDFKSTKPRMEKLDKVRKYISCYGKIDTPIILNENNVLVDGYTRYLVALEYGMKKIPYVRESSGYIVGKFEHSNKEYIWKNTTASNVYVGDKVLVKRNRNDKEECVVTVTGVFASDNPELKKHKSFIKKIKQNNKSEINGHNIKKPLQSYHMYLLKKESNKIKHKILSLLSA